MRRFLLLFFAFFLSITAFSQLEVKPDSFKKVEGFVNLNRDKQFDDNNVLYSIIKVRTENINDKQRHELLFEGNLATFIELEYKTGEVWVYISSKPATYLKISHPDLSSTEFWLPFDLEPKQGYEMVLVNKAATTGPVKDSYNYLIVKADQPNAVISIDGQYAGEGEASQFFKVGETHTWSIECAMYHSENGSATIIKEAPVTIDKKLRPAYGFIKVNTQPENGASVFIDNTKIGESPCTSGRLTSGEHEVRVMKELYATTEQTFTVTDDNTTEAVLNMPINYVNVTINTDAQSNIYINNEDKGKGTWSGRLAASNHIFEAKKPSHKTTFVNATLTLGKDETIVIPDPTPIYGQLNINSSPMGAKIIIDGKECGTTPKIFEDILIGQHEVKIEKEGLTPVIKQINLDETNMISINEKLVAPTVTNSNKETNSQAQKSSFSPSLSNGLVAYYPFDGNANDMSGNGNHGSIINSNNVQLTTGVNGQANSAYHFKGGRIKVNNSESLKFYKECTFSAFVRPTNMKSSDNHTCHCVIAKKFDQVGITFMQYYLEDNKITLDWGIHGNINPTRHWTSQKQSVGMNGHYLNEWVHMVVVVDHDKAKFYLNGKKMYEQTVKTPDFFTYINNQEMYFGQNSANWFGMVGDIDEIRIYNRALTQAEITELYQKTPNEKSITATSSPLPDNMSTRFFDDFDGNSINTQNWKYSGDVRISNGNLVISQSKTDKDMSITTKNLILPPNKKIVIERKFKNHKASDQYHGGFSIHLNGNQDEYVGINYFSANYEKWYGTKVNYKLNGKVNRIDLCPAKYDQWQTEKVVIDFNTGTLSYYLDNKFIQTVTVPGLSSKAISYYNIKFHSYGWFTGHYSEMDYIRISTME